MSNNCDRIPQTIFIALAGLVVLIMIVQTGLVILGPGCLHGNSRVNAQNYAPKWVILKYYYDYAHFLVNWGVELRTHVGASTSPVS